MNAELCAIQALGGPGFELRAANRRAVEARHDWIARLLGCAGQQREQCELRDPANPKKIHRVAVNLFDEIESNIPPVPELQTEYEKIEGTRGVERTRREAWKLILLLALGVLLVEWYVYNRRVYL